MSDDTKVMLMSVKAIAVVLVVWAASCSSLNAYEKRLIATSDSPRDVACAFAVNRGSSAALPLTECPRP